METKLLKPTFSVIDQSSTAVHSAPLWLMKATLPGFAIELAKVAFNPDTGFITPRQFGPSRRIRPWIVCKISASSSAAVLARLLEARRENDARGHAHLHALRQQRRHALGRSAQDHQVGNLGQLLQAGVGAKPQNMGALGIHRVDDAAERVADQVPQHGAAHRAGALAGAHQGHAGRLEDGVQRMPVGPQNIIRGTDIGNRGLANRTHRRSPFEPNLLA